MRQQHKDVVVIVLLLRSHYYKLRNVQAYTNLALNIQDRGMAVISNIAVSETCRTKQFNIGPNKNLVIEKRADVGGTNGDRGVLSERLVIL